MAARSRTFGMLLVAALAVVVSGCGAAPAAKPDDTNDAPAVEPVPPMLMLQGEQVTDSGTSGEPRREEDEQPTTVRQTPVTKALVSLLGDEPWPAPELRADGSIEEGDDPFAGHMLETQPAPIEDDPETTRELDAWSSYLRQMTAEQWARWTAADIRPWQQEQDDTMGSMVRIAVERCGGARTVSAGVVLADDTVVTTVHAIESAARRVWVTPALGEPRRVPAIVRYLDVDDDIAVLKVPGLGLEPIGFYAAPGDVPVLGFAYGLSRGSGTGTMRRTHVLAGVEEQTISVEQPDGFARRIADRSVYPVIGGIDNGFSGGIVTATTDARQRTGWGFHGLIRARVPFRSESAGILVPSRLVRDAVAASQGLDPWFEHRPGGCPQWRR